MKDMRSSVQLRVAQNGGIISTDRYVTREEYPRADCIVAKYL